MRWRRPRLRVRSLLILVALVAVTLWAGTVLVSPTRWLERRLRPGAPAYVRWDAAGMLGGSWVVPPWEVNRAVSALIRALDDPNPMVREQAVMGLGERGAAAARALPELVGRLGDESDGVRYTTAAVLGILAPLSDGRPPRSAIEAALARATGDRDPLVRLRACQSLLDLGREDEAVDGLAGALTGPDEQARSWATSDLERRGPMPPGLAIALVEGLDRLGPDASRAAVARLLDDRSPAAWSLTLQPAATGPDAEAREAARTLSDRIASMSPGVPLGTP